MPQLMNPFDATNIDPTQLGGQMPVGKHPVVIKSSDIKPTKDNTSGMLVLELEIIDGPSKGVTGVYRLNLYHSNPQTVDIAHRQLSSICHVVQRYKILNSEELHGIPFIVEVGLQKDTEAAAKGYTEVKRVFDIHGNEPGKVAAGAATTQQAGNGSGWGAPQTAQQPAPGAQTGWGGTQQPAATEKPAWGAPASASGQPAPQPDASKPSWAR